MGRKVFVSYKYKDENVAELQNLFYEEVNNVMQWNHRNTRVRDYVDLLQNKIGIDNINLGEKDGESLDDFSDEQIETLLKQRIKQCSVTIVIISKGMKDPSKTEKEQWIPWEISYSLRVVPTGGNTKQMNAVLGVVLPDKDNSYEWYYTDDNVCNCRTHNINKLFGILFLNMFNIKEKRYRECNGQKIHTTDEPSFIKTVKWDDFMNDDDYNAYLDKAVEIKEDASSYDVHVNF